jgi:2-desacetyl-2-hydroxyethyl bacteriochlorophyllide A dehydrogenase
MPEAFTVTIEKVGKTGRRPLEPTPLGPRDVRITTLYSGISAGTEMTAFRGTNPYLTKKWNTDTRLFESGSTTMVYPMAAFSYEEVGRISEVGSEVSKLKQGQIVWGTWGHKSEHVASEDWAVERLLPEGTDPRLGIFSQIGAIALNAVLDAEIRIGEFVAVFGQGVPGLMVTQLVRASGGTVIAVDQHEPRLEEAKASGASFTINSAEEPEVAQRIKQITRNRGADVSIEISGTYSALNEAIRSTAYNSRVVVSGFFQGEGLGLALGEEFHHNRIELVCSQIGGVAPGLDHRWDRLRLDQTLMHLVAEGKVDFGRLISHVIPIERAQDAFDLLNEHPEKALQVVLDFTGE